MFSRTRFLLLMCLLLLLVPAAVAAENAKAARTDLYGDPLPPGAVARVGSVRFRIEGIVDSLAFSADGKWLASASWKRLILWDRTTGRRKQEYPIGIFVTAAVGFSAAGDVLLVGIENEYRPTGKRRVFLLRPGSSQKEQLLPFDGFSITALAISADGKRLITDGDKELTIWDLASKKKVGGFSKSNSDMATVRSRYGYASSVLALAPNSQLAAQSDVETGLIHLMDLRAQKTIRKLGRAADKERICCMAFSSDGKTLFAAGWHAVHQWDVAGGKELRRLGEKDSLPVALAVSADGKTLATAEYAEKAIVLWDTATGQNTWPVGMERGSLTLLTYTGPKTLVGVTDRGVICFWDASNGKCLRRLKPERKFGDIFAVSPDGGLLASVADQNRVRVWDTGAGKTRWQIQIQWRYSWVRKLVFSPNGKTLMGLVRTPDAPRVLCWDAVTGKEMSSVSTVADSDQLFLSADGTTVAVGNSRREVHLFRVSPGHKWSLPRPIQLAEGCLHGISSDGRTLLVTAQEVSNQTISTADGKQAGRLGFVEAASGGFAGWLRSGTEAIDVSVRHAAFSPDSKRVAATYADGSVRLWDVVTRRQVERFRADEGEVGLIAFAPDGQTMASERLDRSVLIWQAHPLLNLNDLWRDLAGANVEAAQRAIGKLSASPASSVSYLEKHLPPVPKGDARRLQQLLADLDSATFAVRKKAQQELTKEGEGAEDALQEILKDKPSLELRRRVRELLENLEETRRTLSADDVRVIRTVQVLETIGTAEARQVLTKLSEGASGALRTREARAALRRLTRIAAK